MKIEIQYSLQTIIIFSTEMFKINVGHMFLPNCKAKKLKKNNAQNYSIIFMGGACQFCIRQKIVWDKQITYFILLYGGKNL